MADSTSPNRILLALPVNERSRLEADLEPVELRQQDVLADVGQPLRRVVFPAGGTVSLVTATSEGGSVEAVLIGKEGIAGTWTAAGIANAPWRTVVQSSGPGYLMSPAAFREHMSELPTLARLVARFNLAAHLLTSQSAACNRFHELSARAARWLLMVNDRIGSENVMLTQEFLAQMLGAYRPSVTVALRTLDAAGLIEVHRTRLRLVDRAGLEQLACECYALVRQQTDELLHAGSTGD